jgi:long-chain acyl-CoA synthetase
MSNTSIDTHVQELFTNFASNTFLIDSPFGQKCRYDKFYDLSLRVAKMLYDSGVRKGDRVVLLLTNTIEFPVFFFACFFLKAIVVPINPALHPNEVNFILTHCNARILVFSLCTRPLVLASPASASYSQVCILTEEEHGFHSEEIRIVSRKDIEGYDLFGWKQVKNYYEDSVLTICFTSGTTNTPKGVVHKASSLFNNIIAFNQLVGIGPRSCFLNLWPLAYSSGFLNNLLSAFCAGGSVVISRPFDAQTVLQFWKPIIEYNVNIIWLSPSMIAALNRVDRDPAGLQYCKNNSITICAGTAPLPLKTKVDFENKYGLKIFESYGLSEALLVTGNSSQYPRKNGSAGRLLTGVSVQIVNEFGLDLQTGETGEIVLKTPFLMKGYLNYSTFESDPVESYPYFYTGDIGNTDNEGYLYVTDRKKDIIIRGGMNISPRTISDVLLQHPAVEQATVVGIPHELYGEEVVAVIQLKDGYSLQDQEISILKFCRERLNQISVPTKIIQIEKFPLGATGKLLTKEIRDLVYLKLKA